MEGMWKRVEPTIKTKIDYHEVIVKTFELPDGNLATRATLYAENANAAGVIAITPDKKIIVGRQFRPGPERMMIELPGGYVDEGEEPEVAARRELLEETGYASDKMTYLGGFPKDASINGTWHYYLAMECTLASSVALDHDEFIDVELMSIEDFIANAKKGNMTDPYAALAAYDELLKLKEEL